VVDGHALPEQGTYLRNAQEQEKKMTELQQRMNESWANPETVVTFVREWLTACSRSTRP
jgi:hypothetical protein